MEHGVRSVVNQVAAIDEGNDLHARRQNMTVQFLHFLVNPLKSCIGGRSLSQKNDPRDDIIVVNNLFVFTVNSPSKLAEPKLRSLRNDSNVFYPEWGAILAEDDGF